MPELAGLFEDIGPRTPKIRLDYTDVKVALSEEDYFKPVSNGTKRGMITAATTAAAAATSSNSATFRTQRWNRGPGNDQPGLGRT